MGKRKRITDPVARVIVEMGKKISKMSTPERFDFYQIPHDGYLCYAKGENIVKEYIDGRIEIVGKLRNYE